MNTNLWQNRRCVRSLEWYFLITLCTRLPNCTDYHLIILENTGTSSAGWRGAQLAALLASPISYTEQVLYPNTVAFITQALTVGQIFIVTMSLVITHMLFDPRALKTHPLFVNAKPGKKSNTQFARRLWLFRRSDFLGRFAGINLAMRRIGVTLFFTCLVGTHKSIDTWMHLVGFPVKHFHRIFRNIKLIYILMDVSHSHTFDIRTPTIVKHIFPKTYSTCTYTMEVDRTRLKRCFS